MIIAASKDQSFPVEGVRSVSAYGRELYSSYGTPEKIGFFEDSSEGHGYQRKKREAAYGWFLRWLIQRGDGSPQPEPATDTEPYDSSELRCFEENRPAGPGIVDMVKRLAANLPAAKPDFSLAASPQKPVLTAEDKRAVRISYGLAAGFLLNPPPKAKGFLIAVDDRGKEAVLSDLPVDDLLQRGWAIFGVDPRGIGESATTQMGWVAAVSLLLGENFVMHQAEELRAAMTRLGERPVALYARGPNAALAATYAAWQSGAKIILRGGFQSFRQFFDRPKSLALSFQLRKEDKDRTTAFDREIPFAYVPFAALRSYDLPQLRRADRTLVIDPINGDWEPEGAAMRDPATAILDFLGRPQ
jgi:hypothetical protein